MRSTFVLQAFAAGASAAAADTPAPSSTRAPALPTELPTLTRPPQCATLNITQYLDMPMPTSELLTALRSYAGEILEPCRATAATTGRSPCSITDAAQYCAFSTAAPSDIRPLYASYASEAASWWAASSSAIASVVSECPLDWNGAAPREQAWLREAVTHAECFASATTGSTTGSMTGKGTLETGTGDTADQAKPTNGVTGRAGYGQTWVMAGAGVAGVMGAVLL